MINDSSFENIQRLYRKYHTRDPFQLIEEMPDLCLKRALSFDKDGLKGFSTIMNRVKFVVVNDYLCWEEQRVVAAHELGHIFQHEMRLRACPMRDFDLYNATGRLEREANLFAADFLLGDEEVMDEIHSCEANFFSVAQTLNVPAPFFAFKLYSMIERGYAMKLPVDLDSRFLASGKKRTY